MNKPPIQGNVLGGEEGKTKLRKRKGWEAVVLKTDLTFRYL